MIIILYWLVIGNINQYKGAITPSILAIRKSYIVVNANSKRIVYLHSAQYMIILSVKR